VTGFNACRISSPAAAFACAANNASVANVKNRTEREAALKAARANDVIGRMIISSAGYGRSRLGSRDDSEMKSREEWRVFVSA
jgi:hypothetical protein